MIVALFLCLCVGVNHAMTRTIPEDLTRILAKGQNVTSLQSFLELIYSGQKRQDSLLKPDLQDRASGICPPSVQPTQCPTKVMNLCSDDSNCPSDLKCCNTGCQMDCVRPQVPQSLLGRAIIKSENADLERVVLDNELCSPRPVLFKVPQPTNQAAIYFPFYVALHRCGGACNAKPTVTECTPQEQTDLNLLVFRVAWSSSTDSMDDLSREMVAVRVTNHTKCGCECVTKPSDCDNRTQVYSKDNCRCECKPLQESCHRGFVWDPIRCQCRCNPAIKALCRKRTELDEERCTCVCSSKPCRSGKTRGTDCRCRCPPKKCPPGMVYNKRTCKCERKLSKERKDRRRKLLRSLNGNI